MTFECLRQSRKLNTSLDKNVSSLSLHAFVLPHFASGDHVPAHPDVVWGADRGADRPHCVPPQHRPQLAGGMGQVAGRGGTV